MQIINTVCSNKILHNKNQTKFTGLKENVELRKEVLQEFRK
ncbi:MAG: hypothetical protein WCK67_06170 [bacterium]